MPAGALVIADDQRFWTDQQRAVLYAMGVERYCPKAELAAFLHLCQRRRLDPFLKQVYLIGRTGRDGRRKYTPQTSIDAFRLIAHRAAQKAGTSYGYEPTVYVDWDGTKYEEWIFDRPPAAVKWTVVRADGMRFYAQARYRAYLQLSRDGSPTATWERMPDVMLGKCAEALALRMAWPEDLGGIYTDDEMGQADNPVGVEVKVPSGPVIRATAERVDQPQPQPRRAAARPQAETPRPQDEAPQAETPQGDAADVERLRAAMRKLLVECGIETESAQQATCTALVGVHVKSLDDLDEQQIRKVGQAAKYASKQDKPRAAIAAVMNAAMNRRNKAQGEAA
ncbi:phage recombination protein Bet [Nonomuraea salmonea]|uniref:phage recombination protein Bet n=1 Tax=Nonomuraea salmonea TaxID=46181 RepID=UPI002FEBB806